MFIRTRRLLLRPVWREDADAIFAAIADEQIVRNLATAPWPYRRIDAMHYVDLMQTRTPQPVFVILRLDRANAPLVGGIGIKPGQELGYWVARDHWNQGIVSEAAEAVLQLAFLGYDLDVVEASHALDNPASGAVLERKLGFVQTGFDRLWSEARQDDMAVRKLSLTRTQWAARRGISFVRDSMITRAAA